MVVGNKSAGKLVVILAIVLLLLSFVVGVVRLRKKTAPGPNQPLTLVVTLQLLEQDIQNILLVSQSA